MPVSAMGGRVRPGQGRIGAGRSAAGECLDPPRAFATGGAPRGGAGGGGPLRGRARGLEHSRRGWSCMFPLMFTPSLRPARRTDLPRIHEVRHGTAENRLTDPSLVTDAEVAWYLDFAIFLVSEDEAGVQ